MQKTKLTIQEASQKLGISKEAIHNRIRRGSIEAILEDGVKFIVLNSDVSATKELKTKNEQTKPDDYRTFLEEQNKKLQIRVELLESETRTLRDQKEQLLMQEKLKIEQIYKEKDEQLKNIINAITTQLQLSSFQTQKKADEEVIDTQIDESGSGFISLSKYLKESGFSKKNISKIKKRIDKNKNSDKRFVKIGKKYYCNESLT